MTTKYRDDLISEKEIRMRWLQTEAGTDQIVAPPNQRLETYWQVSMSQIGLRIRRIKNLFKEHPFAETDGLMKQLSEMEKEFNLCVEIGRRLFSKLAD